MPATVAGPNRSLDSEKISPATIAHYTVYEKIPNLHQSHMCQWGAQPYLVGPLSPLVGKPPFSPWLSRNILPLKRAANGPNSAISLTQTFDRNSLCVYNSLYFGVQKAKNGDRGTIVFTATLNIDNTTSVNREKMYLVFLFMSAACVLCVFSPHSFWTSNSLDVPAGVTQEEGRTGFLMHLLSAVRALIVLARRNQPFLSLVDRQVMANNI